MPRESYTPVREVISTRIIPIGSHRRLSSSRLPYRRVAVIGHISRRRAALTGYASLTGVQLTGHAAHRISDLEKNIWKKKFLGKAPYTQP
jgi:hypothetical protein